MRPSSAPAPKRGPRCSSTSRSSIIGSACTQPWAIALQPKPGPAWRRSLCARQPDILIAPLHSQGGSPKLSFHTPLYCARAFTTEHGTPAGMENRDMFNWQRAETPPAGEGRVSCVARMAFPTDYLSTALEPIRRAITWIPAAPSGMSTVVDCLFTYDDERSFRQFASHGNVQVVTYLPLDADAFA